MFDLLSILISVSNMLMLYGVSRSIKKSVDRQAREDRIANTLDDLFEEEISTQSNIDHQNLIDTMGSDSRRTGRHINGTTTRHDDR